MAETGGAGGGSTTTANGPSESGTGSSPFRKWITLSFLSAGGSRKCSISQRYRAPAGMIGLRNTMPISVNNEP